MVGGGPVRSIRWGEVFPATMLVRAAWTAADIRKLMLASVAALLMPTGWWLLATMQEATSENADLPGSVRTILLPSWTPFASGGVTAGSPPAVSVGEPNAAERILIANPIYASWEFISRPARSMFARTATAGDVFWLLLCTLWAIIVWGFCGGAICRMTAVELATQQRAGVGAALAFTIVRWRSFVAAPMLPLVGMALVVIIVLLVPGLFLRMGTVGELLAGLLWPILLVVGGIMLATLGVGLYFGWALLWGAIATDGSDGFDAVSRTYAYTYQRPIHLGAYLVLASLLGWFLWILISIFAFAVVELTSWGASWTGGEEAWVQRPLYAMPLADFQIAQRDLIAPLGSGMGPFTGYRDATGQWNASALRGLAIDGVRLMVLGFVYSYFWTIATAIYMLLRRSVDATELDEVWLEHPAMHTPLPTLVQDEAGVPVVATEPAVDDASAPQGDVSPEPEPPTPPEEPRA